VITSQIQIYHRQMVMFILSLINIFCYYEIFTVLASQYTKNRNFLETSTPILTNFFPQIPSTMQKVHVDWSLNVFYSVKLHTL
jgi:hypothetical protein